MDEEPNFPLLAAIAVLLEIAETFPGDEDDEYDRTLRAVATVREHFAMPPELEKALLQIEKFEAPVSIPA